MGEASVNHEDQPRRGASYSAVALLAIGVAAALTLLLSVTDPTGGPTAVLLLLLGAMLAITAVACWCLLAYRVVTAKTRGRSVQPQAKPSRAILVALVAVPMIGIATTVLLVMHAPHAVAFGAQRPLIEQALTRGDCPERIVWAHVNACSVADGITSISVDGGAVLAHYVHLDEHASTPSSWQTEAVRAIALGGDWYYVVSEW